MRFEILTSEIICHGQLAPRIKLIGRYFVRRYRRPEGCRVFSAKVWYCKILQWSLNVCQDEVNLELMMFLL